MIADEIVEARPSAVVAINRVAFDAPWQWLAAGWRDFLAAPGAALGFGGMFASIAAASTLGLAAYGLEALILPLCGGFLLVAPAAAVALYETSRHLERGRNVRLGEALTWVGSVSSQICFFGAILVFVYLVWLLLAFLLFMLFFGPAQIPPARDFVPTLLFTWHGLGLLVMGTITGAIIAALTFAISVVSVPILMAERLDAVTAMRLSLSAVARNPKTMLLWASLIAGFSALGLATLFVGLVVVFPLIGFATWHAFKDLVRLQPKDYL